MRIALARFLPDGLAARFALLFASALIAANLSALLVLASAHEQAARGDLEARDAREIERIAALVSALEVAQPQWRDRVARAASVPAARAKVGPEPAIAGTLTDTRSRTLAKGLSAALTPRTVRVAPLEPELVEGHQPSGSNSPYGRGKWYTVVISIALSGSDTQADAPIWLNVTALIESRGMGSHVQDEAFVLILALSMVMVLGLGLLFVRRLTRPLSRLAEAARAAGQGDRSARVAERGAREFREVAFAFNAMQERIDRFDAERARTVAAVGHDLRTPITSLRIRAEMLDDTVREPMIRTLAEMIVMADGLVAFSRGQNDVETKGPVHLAKLLRRLGEERGARVSVSAKPVVSGRPVALTRAFGNLIDNAIRYGEQARVELTCSAQQAVILIDDRGPGIAQERIADVFEPFVRGEASRSAETGGVGLGLSIARRIILAHRGTITLTNLDAGGLRATISLPLAAQSQVADPAATSDRSSHATA